MIIIVDHNKVPKLQVAGGTGCLTGYTFHSTSIPEEAECVTINEIEAVFVEVGSGRSLSDGQPHSIGETLTQRASSHLHARGIGELGMTRRDAVDSLGTSQPSHF